MTFLHVKGVVSTAASTVVELIPSTGFYFHLKLIRNLLKKKESDEAYIKVFSFD
jgi:hypothetical protein